MNERFKVCRKCSAVNDETATECRVCGAPLGEGAYSADQGYAAPAAPPQFSAPYAPPSPPPPAPTAPAGDASQSGATFGNPPPTADYNGAAFGNPPPHAGGFTPQGGPTPPQGNYTAPPYFAPPPPPFENNVTAAELELFVGDKAHVYLPKFIKKSYGKKAGFSAILFVFGIIFNLIVQSFWFFHRRMNKIGAGVFAVGMIFAAAFSVFAVDAVKNMGEATGVLIESGAADFDIAADGHNYNFTYDMQDLTREQRQEYLRHFTAVMGDFGAMTMINLVQLAFGILLSVFGDYFYYKFAVRKITAAKARADYNPESLRYIGGTKSAVWIVLLIAMIVLMFVLVFCLLSVLQSVGLPLLNAAP
ncbi:MAG: hypothetical protein ACI4IV_02835 [Acutalibacteraceae bacterium]